MSIVELQAAELTHSTSHVVDKGKSVAGPSRMHNDSGHRTDTNKADGAHVNSLVQRTARHLDDEVTIEDWFAGMSNDEDEAMEGSSMGLR